MLHPVRGLPQAGPSLPLMFPRGIPSALFDYVCGAVQSSKACGREGSLLARLPNSRAVTSVLRPPHGPPVPLRFTGSRLAFICGVEIFDDLERIAKFKESWLRGFLKHPRPRSRRLDQRPRSYRQHPWGQAEHRNNLIGAEIEFESHHSARGAVGFMAGMSMLGC